MTPSTTLFDYGNAMIRSCQYRHKVYSHVHDIHVMAMHVRGHGIMLEFSIMLYIISYTFFRVPPGFRCTISNH